MDLEAGKTQLAQVLQALEGKIEQLVAALAHEELWITLESVSNPRGAVRRACEAIATIDYAMEDATDQSVVCLGVIGVSAQTLKRAQAVNEAKAEFKKVCGSFKGLRIRVPNKDSSGTIAIQATRVLLRNIQRSDLNMHAAYRKIPILDALPRTISYTVAQTRNVYRKSVEEVSDLLANRTGPAAERDRGRLDALARAETHLALARPHYVNTRANVLYARLDSRGRGRVQIPAELPVLFAMRSRDPPPVVAFPASDSVAGGGVRRIRKQQIQESAFLTSIPIYRYLS